MFSLLMTDQKATEQQWGPPPSTTCPTDGSPPAVSSATTSMGGRLPPTMRNISRSLRGFYELKKGQRFRKINVKPERGFRTICLTVSQIRN